MSTDLWDDVFLQLIREEGGGRKVTCEVEPGNLLHPLLVLLLEQQPRLLMLRLQQTRVTWIIREKGGGREVTGEVEPGNLLHPLLVLLL